MIIRLEQEKDYRDVEVLTKKAFWNLYVPGCDEHYLVHKMRQHDDFISDLAYVLIKDEKIIGNIMYTKSRLKNEKNEIIEIVSFGPVSIDPEYQRQGYGRKLIEYTFEKVAQKGIDFIVIYGNPNNYVGLGFKSCKKFNIHVGDLEYPSALLVKQIGENKLNDNKWEYIESEVYSINNVEAEEYDKKFEHMEKKENNHQEEFYILSNSRIKKSI